MEVYILSGARTPSGNFLGGLGSVSATLLGAHSIKGALKKAEVQSSLVDEVFMGQVLSAGCGQAPAKQAAIFAELGNSIPCTTLNKVCGSGMQAVIEATRSIICGDNQVVVAGGMENMSLTPHLISLRKGHKYGESSLKDSMQFDGLWDVYADCSMGDCAQKCADKYNFTRKEQDNFAIESFKRAQAAMEQGIFDQEVVPVTTKVRGKEVVIARDESPLKVDFAKIPLLKPAFSKDGNITAANSSTINDGAAALVLATKEYKDKAKFKIVSYAGHSGESTWFTIAPIKSIKKCVERAGLKLEDIDLFEINEAFATVTMAAIKELNLDHQKVNIYGGAVSLGHPIGCSGARIIVTLMTAMENKAARFGCASICIGGGEALSIILEKI